MLAKTPKHAFQEFDWLEQLDPVYDKARRDLATLIWTPESPSLAVKYREIIAAVILACRSYPTTDAHIRRAIAEGASLMEVVEGFQTATVPGGFPVLHFALPLLKQVHQDFGDEVLGPRSEEGSSLAVEAARTPAHAMPVWDWMREIDPNYDEARRQYTALAWTPERPALPVKIRELIAAAVLAYRSYPTVDAHLRRAVEEGADIRELVETMQTAAMPGGFPVLHFSLPFLIAIDEELKAGTFNT